MRGETADDNLLTNSVRSPSTDRIFNPQAPYIYRKPSDNNQ